MNSELKNGTFILDEFKIYSENITIDYLNQLIAATFT